MPAAWTRHPFIAGLVGVLAGGLAIALIEWLGHQWLGMADVARPDTIRASQFASVLVAWVVGAGTAAGVATAWNGGRSGVPGLVAAGALIAGSVATMFAIPHPVWMVAAALVLMPAAAWWAVRSLLAGARSR
jgi:hypothetical protein